MEKEKENLMKAYERRLWNYEDDFKISCEEIINKKSKTICDHLEDELHQIGGIRVIDNDNDLRKRIIKKIEDVLAEYKDVIRLNVEKQSNQLVDLKNGMSIYDMKGINYEEINFDKLNDITRSITDSLITHINFENQNNSMYHQKIRKVEELVKQEVNPDKIKNILDEINNIYEEIIGRMNDQCKEFNQIMGEIQYKEDNPIQEISKNEQPFLTDNQLSTEGIFDNYESENARIFK